MNIKQVFSSYTSTPAGTVSQVTLLLDDETILIYRPKTIQNGKVLYEWVKLPNLPEDISNIPVF